MRTLRQTLLRHRALAALVVALALVLRVLVPAGMMVGSDAGVVTVKVCADASGTHDAVISVPLTTGEHGADPAGAHDGACPYGALAMAGLAATDPLLLAAALGFILALGFAAIAAPAPQVGARWRPWLRGPPARG